MFRDKSKVLWQGLRLQTHVFPSLRFQGKTILFFGPKVLRLLPDLERFVVFLELRKKKAFSYNFFPIVRLREAPLIYAHEMWAILLNFLCSKSSKKLHG